MTDISRIERNAPTITEISDRGGKVILLSHYGRPKGRDPKESLKPVAAAVARIIGRPVDFADDCVGEVAEQAAARLRTPASTKAKKRTIPLSRPDWRS